METVMTDSDLHTSAGLETSPAEPSRAEESTTSPFDPQNLRLSQDFIAQAGARKLINTIPVRKPGRQAFVRTHPEAAFWLETAVLELKDDRETYLVIPALWADLSAELTPKVLVLTIDRQNNLSLWPIRLPGEEGRIDDWNAAALEAARLAQGRWLRISANMTLGAYDVFEAVGELPDPQWPDLSMQQILAVAFRGRMIDDLNHPVISRLQGAA